MCGTHVVFFVIIIIITVFTLGKPQKLGHSMNGIVRCQEAADTVVLFGRELGNKSVLNLVLKEVSREKSGRGSFLLSTRFLEENVCVIRKRVISKLWFANSIVSFAIPIELHKIQGILFV